MAGQIDSEFRSVAVTETSRNVVCLMLYVFQRGSIEIPGEALICQAFTCNIRSEKRKVI